MSRPYVWPKDTIRELLALAVTQGEAKAVLETEDEAKNFRFAIYGFLRRSALGCKIGATLNGKEVLLKRYDPRNVQIAAPFGDSDGENCATEELY